MTTFDLPFLYPQVFPLLVNQLCLAILLEFIQRWLHMSSQLSQQSLVLFVTKGQKYRYQNDFQLRIINMKLDPNFLCLLISYCLKLCMISNENFNLAYTCHIHVKAFLFHFLITQVHGVKKSFEEFIRGKTWSESASDIRSIAGPRLS